MTTKDLKAMGVDPSEFGSIIAEEDIILDDLITIDDEEDDE